MRKTIITIGIMFLFVSCGKDKQKENTKGLKNMIEGVSDLNKMAEAAEKIEEENERLLATTPISNDKLKSILPESLLRYPRKSFSVGNQLMPGMAMGKADYKDENENSISLSIIDGAGETGSAMVTLAKLGFARGFEEQTDRGYKKSTIINGYKALEEVKKDSYSDVVNTKIDFIVANRFLISIKGESIPLDELKKAINELNLKDLK